MLIESRKGTADLFGAVLAQQSLFHFVLNLFDDLAGPGPLRLFPSCRKSLRLLVPVAPQSTVTLQFLANRRLTEADHISNRNLAHSFFIHPFDYGTFCLAETPIVFFKHLLFLVKTTLENASALCTDLIFPNFLNPPLMDS